MIELIHEKRIDGTEVYYTNIDGHYVPNSLTLKLEEAEKMFSFIVKNGSADPDKTVIRAHPSSTRSANSSDTHVTSLI